jgi:hypothetical protein
MCDECKQAGSAQGGYAQAGIEKSKLKENTLRERLERRQNQLTREIAQIAAALQLIYTNPDAERIVETFNRAGF